MQKCPQCHKGNMFVGNTYSTTFSKAEKKCSNCRLEFEIEPGFFTGAMYFSYAINVAIIVIVGLSLEIIFKPNMYWLMGTIIGVATLLFPANFRYSRMLMMYLFSGVNFDSSLNRKA